MPPTYKPVDVAPFLKAIERPKKLQGVFSNALQQGVSDDFNELTLEDKRRDVERERSLDEVYSDMGKVASEKGYETAQKQLPQALAEKGLGRELFKVMKEGRELEEKALEKKRKTLELLYKSGQEDKAMELAQSEGLVIDFNQYNKRQKIGNDIYEISPSGRSKKILSVPKQGNSAFGDTQTMINPKTKKEVIISNDKEKNALIREGYKEGDSSDLLDADKYEVVPKEVLFQRIENDKRKRKAALEKQARLKQSAKTAKEAGWSREDRAQFLGGGASTPNLIDEVILRGLRREYGAKNVKVSRNGDILYKDKDGQVKKYGK